MSVCTSLSLEQEQTKQTVQKPKEEQQTVEVPKAEGFVNNYDLYAKYFDKGTKPNPEDIKTLRDKYFNFEISPKTGLQEQARAFVREGKRRQLLNENPSLIGTIAQTQAYVGNGQWNAVNRERAQSIEPSPILRMDYVNTSGPMGSRPFDVTIYSFFHTILEQADKDLPRDEKVYKALREEIEKGIRVRHLMQH
jgi:hypothetical protein